MLIGTLEGKVVCYILGAVSQTRLLTSNQQSNGKVNKSLLSKLRKETGFGFAKCMESLRLNKNDYNEALRWLEAEAEKQGWEKATKLQGRTVSEGLVGVLVDGNFAAMVEVTKLFQFILVCDHFNLLIPRRGILNQNSTTTEHFILQNAEKNKWYHGKDLLHHKTLSTDYMFTLGLKCLRR